MTGSNTMQSSIVESRVPKKPIGVDWSSRSNCEFFSDRDGYCWQMQKDTKTGLLKPVLIQEPNRPIRPFPGHLSGVGHSTTHGRW